jgi:hypothetical protein
MKQQRGTIAGGSVPPIAATRLPAILFSLLLPAALWAGGSVGNGSDDMAPPPGLVLAHYTMALQQNSHRLECRKVALEIDASLPKLAEHGRLHAIRELVLGRPQYQALRIEGDRTVRQQVIARYLSAEAQAEALPSDSVAVSPANYKFRYKGSIGSAGTLAYVFEITPRRKRAGLIQGELWIDSASGLAVRKAGRLVKMPSVFLRRIDVAQDSYILNGEPYLRITNMAIDTRLIGRAELTIRERVCAPEGDQEPPTTLAMRGGPIDEPACSTTP